MTSNKMTIGEFNEAHQKTFGYSPRFGEPQRSGPDHCPEVSVTLEVNGVEPITGKGSNQKLARQDAVDQFFAVGNTLSAPRSSQGNRGRGRYIDPHKRYPQLRVGGRAEASSSSFGINRDEEDF